MFGRGRPRAQYNTILCLFSLIPVAMSVIPWRISWTDDAVGPDGPWNALMIGFDAPTQNITLLPSLTKTTFLVQDVSCSSSNAACPLPLPTMWTDSTAHIAFDWMDGPSFDTSTWDDSLAPLQMQGSGFQTHETLHMFNEPKNNQAESENQGIVVTNDTVVTYPGGMNYTMDVGFFSLEGVTSTQNWTSNNGSAISLDDQVPSFYAEGNIPSNSYSLHIGSPTYNIPGSLVLGGYDRSRVLTAPIISSNTTFQLMSLSIAIQNGTSAFLNTTNTSTPSTSGFAFENVIASDTLTVLPNPGVPYLYLPRATCDAIAAHLPVTYSADFNLYIWTTSSPAYTKILTSPHLLSLNLSSSSSDGTSTSTTINIPFALLNLTLTSPLVSTDTQFFPCSPYSPSSTSPSQNHLGRAFLQAAFLAQIYDNDTTTSFLSQAPGPDATFGVENEVITTLLPDNDSSAQIAALVNGEDWASTWTTTLPPLDASSSAPSASNATATGAVSGAKLSPGAIAGIVIGAVAGVLLSILVAVLLILRRRRHQRQRQRQRLPTLASETSDSAFQSNNATSDAMTSHTTSTSTYPSPPTPEPQWLLRQGGNHVFGSGVQEAGGADIHEVDAEGGRVRAELGASWGKKEEGEGEGEARELEGEGRKIGVVELEGSFGGR